VIAEPDAKSTETLSTERWRLSCLSVSGFKSLEKIKFGFRTINALIGANGAGKSNLIDALRMLVHMMDASGQLRGFVGINGGASRLLHFGAKVTQRIEFELDLRSATSARVLRYRAKLALAKDETLIFESEECRLDEQDHPESVRWDQLRGDSLGSGHSESRLNRTATEKSQAILKIIRGIRIFQFRDTSYTSALRLNSDFHDTRFVREFGGQLPTVLKRIKQQDGRRYDLICGFIRMIYPTFHAFEFLPVGETAIRLGWRERMSDYVFDVSQASDGTLRFFALATILLSDPVELPSILVIDEPELGLHPSALAVLADMIRIAAAHCQIILATQSPLLIDQFELGDIVGNYQENWANQASSCLPALRQMG